MANPWFRLYSEFATDPKVQRLSECVQRRYIMLLCMRCCNGDETLHDDDVTFHLRISDEEWGNTKAVLREKNLIDSDNKPTAWGKRQFSSDSSTERVGKHRKGKNKDCNGDETLQKRKCNVPEQNRTEQNIKTIPPKTGGFDRFWETWPKTDRKESKSQCATLWREKKLEPKTEEIIKHVEYCKANKWKDPQYTPAPIVYLRSARWDGAETADQAFDMNNFLSKVNAS